VVSLPGGLVEAGVPAVVGSQWRVRELTTAMLMSIFFDKWRGEELSPAEALRQAQITVRDSVSAEHYRQYLSEYADHTMTPAAVADEFCKAAQLEDYTHPYYWAGFMYVGK